ncbi:MAG: methylated-DNA--[protein]-cysteine S-methyltransferase [Opitutales bacterium]
MASDYHRVALALSFLLAEQKGGRRVGLRDLGQHLGLSPFHLQRLFRRWAGLSPQQFIQVVSHEAARQRLEQSAPVLDAALAAGLSGTGRLHDLTLRLEGMTPGEIKRAGEGLVLTYGFHPGPFGDTLVVRAPRGLAGLAFADPDPAARNRALEDMRARWPEARFEANAGATRAVADRLFASPADAADFPPLRLLVRGSSFQIQVWSALLRIPPGHVVAYSRLAEALGRPGAARAVGGAVGANPISYLIPCHRVIRSLGIPGDYHWGAIRKAAMLAWESPQAPGAND